MPKIEVNKLSPMGSRLNFLREQVGDFLEDFQIHITPEEHAAGLKLRRDLAVLRTKIEKRLNKLPQPRDK